MRDDFFTWIKFNIPINIYQTLNVNDGNLNMIPKQKLIETIKELELNKITTFQVNFICIILNNRFQYKIGVLIALRGWRMIIHFFVFT